MTDRKEIDVTAMLGLTLREISGATRNSEEIVFVTTDGQRFRLYHRRDCCEGVSLEDITGNINDLLGSPLTKAELVESRENPTGVAVPEYQDSFTWSFYHFATVKGYVTLRWYGESNGYYSETVAFGRAP